MAVAPTCTGNPSANLPTWANATKPKIAVATLQNACLGISGSPVSTHGYALDQAA
jgi:hypothetical protein